MPHFLLIYEIAPDYLQRRPLYRDRHLDHAWAAVERGELILGGATGDPPDGAMLLFAGRSAAVAERFARDDPYVTNGIVTGWHVRAWTTVVGRDAATPVRPVS